MNDKPNGIPKPDSKGALRRLLIVLAFAIGTLIYSYGWTITDVDLALPQEARRQDNVTRAMRELLSPRVFDQARELATYETSILMDCSTGEAPVQAVPSDPTQPYVVVEPACASVDEIVTVYIYNAAPNSDARIRWQPPLIEGQEVNARPMTVIETDREDIVLGNDGSFIGTIEVPRIRAGEGQIHSLQALVAVPSGAIVFSDTANQVLARMAETIFMALIATTVAIPISVFISFFAAKNLMKRLRLSVGSMLLAFLSLALGSWLGINYLVWLAEWGLNIGKAMVLPQPIAGILAIAVPILVALLFSFLINYLTKLSDSKDKRENHSNPIIQAASALLSSLVAIFIFGAIAGLCIFLGQNITSIANTWRPAEVLNMLTWSQNAFADLIWSFGNLLVLIGTASELFRSGITAILAGFGLAAIMSALFGSSLRRITGTTSRILAAIMGALSGAIIMMVAAALGLWAALLGIIPLIVGGLLAGNLLLQIYARIEKANPNIKATFSQSSVRNLIFAIGFFGMAYFLFNSLSLARSLIDGTLPPQNLVQFMGTEWPITVYMFNAAWVGALLGAMSGGIASLQGIFPLGDNLYNFSRITLNMVRSIEPLIMGLVFVIWVGIGPFAGVLALTLHSIASLGKLYSEQIENIDQGPIEALESTGANQLQIILYAVVPQIIPPYIAFTMYRWDVNVRMSTIIGFVGGGGIGLLLMQQINLLRYRDAGVAVLAIAVVVSVLDYASASIREHIG